MKSRLFFFAAAAFLGLTLFAGTNSWESASSYALYYGGPKEETVTALATYDIAVIDPAALGGEARAVIKTLKEKGCVVIGYLSCFEVATWHRYASRVNEDWLVKVDGKVWTPWGTNHAVSLANPEWRALLVSLVKSEVLDYGCDGVFMDTLADIDNPTLPVAEKKRQLEGLKELLSAFDKAYPGAKFIGNWTLQETLPVVAPYIDGLCWEDFAPANWDKDSPNFSWVSAIRKNIAAQNEKYPFRVFTLWNTDEPGKDTPADQKKMRTISRSFGYVPYCAVGGYTAPGIRPCK